MYVLPVQYAMDNMSKELASNAESLTDVLGRCDALDNNLADSVRGPP